MPTPNPLDAQQRKFFNACKKGRLAEAKALLAQGVGPVDMRAKKDRTPLHEAIYRGKEEVTAFLLENGADPDAADEVGWTALMYAARWQRLESLKLAAALSKNLTAVNSFKSSVLFYVQSPAAALIILDNPNWDSQELMRRNDIGVMPVDHHQFQGRPEVAQAFIQHSRFLELPVESQTLQKRLIQGSKAERVFASALRALHPLGGGHFGDTFRAQYHSKNPEHRGGVVDVVLKVPKLTDAYLDPKNRAEVEARELEEMDALRALPAHPHVVPLIGRCTVGVDDLSDARAAWTAALAKVAQRDSGGESTAAATAAAAGGDAADQSASVSLAASALLEHVELKGSARKPTGANPAMSTISALVLEYKSGGDVRHFLRSFGGMTLPVALKLARDMCAAVAHLHANGLLHRDLACRNFLLAAPNTLHVLVTDMGLARAIDGASPAVSNTADGADGRQELQGEQEAQESSPEYAGVDESADSSTTTAGGYQMHRNVALPWMWTAPEVYTTKQFLHASDMWSLGVALHELWNQGESPYALTSPPVRSVGDLLRRTIGGKKHVLATHGRGGREIPEVFMALIDRCCQVDPSKRPKAETLLQDVEALLERVGLPSVVLDQREQQPTDAAPPAAPNRMLSRLLSYGMYGNTPFSGEEGATGESDDESEDPAGTVQASADDVPGTRGADATPALYGMYEPLSDAKGGGVRDWDALSDDDSLEPSQLAPTPLLRSVSSQQQHQQLLLHGIGAGTPAAPEAASAVGTFAAETPAAGADEETAQAPQTWSPVDLPNADAPWSDWCTVPQWGLCADGPLVHAGESRVRTHFGTAVLGAALPAGHCYALTLRVGQWLSPCLVALGVSNAAVINTEFVPGVAIQHQDITESSSGAIMLASSGCVYTHKNTRTRTGGFASLSAQCHFVQPGSTLRMELDVRDSAQRTMCVEVDGRPLAELLRLPTGRSEPPEATWRFCVYLQYGICGETAFEFLSLSKLDDGAIPAPGTLKDAE